MDPVQFFLSKILPVLAGLAKAEFGTVVGKLNLFLALILAVLVYFLQDNLLSQSTLAQAIDAGVVGSILITIIVILALPFLTILASLFLVYKEIAGRK